MPFTCLICSNERRNAGATVCSTCDNQVCAECWHSWCHTDANRNKWQVPCPFCRTPISAPEPPSTPTPTPTPARTSTRTSAPRNPTPTPPPPTPFCEQAYNIALERTLSELRASLLRISLASPDASPDATAVHMDAQGNHTIVRTTCDATTTRGRQCTRLSRIGSKCTYHAGVEQRTLAIAIANGS